MAFGLAPRFAISRSCAEALPAFLVIELASKMPPAELNRSAKFDVLVRVHNFVVLRENVQKNEKSVHM